VPKMDGLGPPSTLAEPFKAVFWGVVRTPAEKQNWDSINAGRQACIDALGTVEKALAEQPYLSGDAIGMAISPWAALFTPGLKCPSNARPCPTWRLGTNACNSARRTAKR